MNEQHPITPPPELVQQWIKECYQPDDPHWQENEQDIANRAAQWGADQELEATLAEVSFLNSRALADRVRAARRPKPEWPTVMAIIKLADEIEAEGLGQVDLVRRALSRWGRPTTTTANQEG